MKRGQCSRCGHVFMAGSSGELVSAILDHYAEEHPDLWVQDEI